MSSFLQQPNHIIDVIVAVVRVIGCLCIFFGGGFALLANWDIRVGRRELDRFERENDPERVTQEQANIKEDSQKLTRDIVVICIGVSIILSTFLF